MKDFFVSFFRKKIISFEGFSIRSQEGAAAAVALPGAALRRRRRDRREVGVDLDVGQVAPKPPNPGPGDQLTVVQLDPLEVVARNEIVQG